MRSSNNRRRIMTPAEAIQANKKAVEDLKASLGSILNYQDKSLYLTALRVTSDIIASNIKGLNDGVVTVNGVDMVETVVDRVYNSGSVSLGSGSYANILQASLSIPTHWNTYDVEAHWAGYLADASGGSTGTAVTLTQMVHQGGNFDTGPIAHEIEAQNNHDLNDLAGVDYVEGLTPIGTRLFTLQSQVSSGNATNFSRPRLIVRAWRVT